MRTVSDVVTRLGIDAIAVVTKAEEIIDEHLDRATDTSAIRVDLARVIGLTDIRRADIANIYSRGGWRCGWERADGKSESTIFTLEPK
jgi:hypothetical protein